MGLVATVKTPLTFDGLIDATISGYRHLMGANPSPEATSVAVAQAAIESGNGKSMKNNNPGNRKKPKDWEGDFCQYECDEIFDSKMTALAQKLGHTEVSLWKGGPKYRVVLFPPHPWSSFVSFPTLGEGFSDWLGLLALADRYRIAWHYLFIGDAAGFVHALHAAGYMTADEETYKRAVVSISKKALPGCRNRLAGNELGLTDDDRAHVLDFVSLTLSNTIWTPERHGELAA